ncbi:hypothetical protein ISS86_01940 [Candidatus Microgenomates bacterium]|nr:hypothetical protein [Candidatus Microgenomates bacterium]
MKKILIITLSILLILVFLPVVVLSQGQGNQTQNQNKVQIQNQGEDKQLQVNTQEQENLQANEESVGTQGRSENARQHMNVVDETVEELLTTQGAKGGIGQQVSELAREQKQSQQEIEGELDKLDSRRGWMKRLFGPDYKAIKNLNRQMEQNQLRIQQLQQLQNQAANQADETQLQEAVQALVEQKTSLEEQIQAEEQVGSLFGWLVRLFTK